MDTQYVLGMRVTAPDRVHQAVTCLEEAHTHTHIRRRVAVTRPGAQHGELSLEFRGGELRRYVGSIPRRLTRLPPDDDAVRGGSRRVWAGHEVAVSDRVYLTIPQLE